MTLGPAVVPGPDHEDRRTLTGSAGGGAESDGRLGMRRMLGPLEVAVAQPVCHPGRIDLNAAAQAAEVRATSASLVVFPELSLTGYVLDADEVDVTGGALDPVVEACAATGATALVGVPVRIDGGRRIAVVAVTAAGAAVAYCKVHLDGDEVQHFAPGPGPALVEVAGRRVGLGVCKDTRIDEHLTGTLGQGIDLYAAGLVHALDERAQLPNRAARIAQEGRVPVAFASAAGVAGPTYLRAAGGSGVWDRTGDLLAGAGPEAGAVASAIFSSNPLAAHRRGDVPPQPPSDR
jgi:predicted amidohydrolase